MTITSLHYPRTACFDICKMILTIDFIQTANKAWSIHLTFNLNVYDWHLYMMNANVKLHNEAILFSKNFKSLNLY